MTFFAHEKLKEPSSKVAHNLIFFPVLTWLPKGPFFGRNRNLEGSPCLLSIYSLTMVHSKVPTDRTSDQSRNRSLDGKKSVNQKEMLGNVGSTLELAFYAKKNQIGIQISSHGQTKYVNSCEKLFINIKCSTKWEILFIPTEFIYSILVSIHLYSTGFQFVLSFYFYRFHVHQLFG